MSPREPSGLSNVPIYQELARRVGLAPMGEQVARLDYGNRIGTQVDRFARWPAPDQRHGAGALFSRRLAEGSLPFPAAAAQCGVGHHPSGAGPGWTLHGKTGWWNAPGPGLGWWVGWVDRQAASSPLP